MQAVSDEQLIQWVAGGDASCLGTLFERHHRGVYQYCLQLTRSPAASEDLVQDVFLKLLRKAASFRGTGSCKAWIYNIARNVTFDYLRSAQRRTSVDDEGEGAADSLVDHRSSEQAAAAEQNLSLVARALAELPATAREVIWLGRFVFEDYEELARALDCTASAARVRMHRAMQQLNSTFIRMNGVPIDV
ncbi:MAG TPA: RNA polymerase sigma factor [Steroidobacteraceae bacterium]|nr:RNA polymerase sigma factor [Steroidobacteraceae bacterium]